MVETKVFSINGEPLPSAGAPVVESVVRHLEDLLERARSGELRGIAYALADRQEGTFGVAGLYRRDILVGQMEIAKQWVIQQFFEDMGLISGERHPEPPAA